LAALDGTPENVTAAFRTDPAGFFVPNPCFGALFSPVRDRAQDHLFADRHREVFDMPAGDFVARVAAFIAPISLTTVPLTVEREGMANQR